VRTGRQGGLIAGRKGGKKGGKRRLETMTAAARTAVAYDAALESGEVRHAAMMKRAVPVLKLVAEGVSKAEIAERLGIPLSTVYRLARDAKGA